MSVVGRKLQSRVPLSSHQTKTSKASQKARTLPPQDPLYTFRVRTRHKGSSPWGRKELDTSDVT